MKNIMIASGTSTGNGLDNGCTEQFRSGTVNVGDKIILRTDNEGGNIVFYSPSGVEFQMDAYNGSFRLLKKAVGGNYETILNESDILYLHNLKK